MVAGDQTITQCNYFPTFYSWGIFQAPLKTVVSHDKKWKNGLGGYSYAKKSGGIASAMQDLSPLCAPLTKYVFIGFDNKFTVYFDNFILGSDAVGPISVLSKKIGCLSILITCKPNIKNVWYGQTRMDIISPSGAEKRVLCASNDGGRWDWFGLGTPFEWENISAYENRKIADRFTPHMLIQYCKHFGIDLFNIEKFDSPYYLVTNNRINPSKCRHEQMCALPAPI